MRENIQSIAYQIDKGVMLVEFGSGSSSKTRILLDALIEPVAYVPVDISRHHLLNTAEQLELAYPEIEILPVVADFTEPFELPESQREPTHVALYFPGSTIGNFEPRKAGQLLEFMSTLLGPQGGLVIGIDLQKDREVLHRAYDDARGITAAFNLNLLKRINRELNGSFDLDQFRHSATYNEEFHRIEMSLVSMTEQTVSVEGQPFSFDEGETILTEYSHKYTVEGFADFAAQYGFSLHKHWTDDRQYFAILHLVLAA